MSQRQSDGPADARDDRVPDVSPETPALHWRGMLRLLRALPQGAMSRSFGHVADIRLPRALRRPVLSAFANMMDINVSEAEKDYAEYGSINEFFVRRLVPGARTIDARPNGVVSPVDGIVGRAGPITNDTLVQAKGRYYTANSLLGDPVRARVFEGGTFITIYLSPRHYHRIHAPVTGDITAAVHIPGALLPVNAPSVQHIEDLFPKNERLVCHLQSPHGAVAVVAVGAYNVGRISAAFDTAWCNGASITNRAGATRETRSYDPPVEAHAGSEIMAFHLGSTVVLLFENPVTLDAHVRPGAEVRMGAGVGTFSGMKRAQQL